MTPWMWLIAGSLVAAPPTAGRMIPLRVERGQEFVYFASYERRGERPTAYQTCQLVSHVLILDVDASGIQAAFMTEQRLPRAAASESVGLVRLELGRITPSGRVVWEAKSPGGRLPIDMPPTLEFYPFLELPTAELQPGQSWRMEDPETGPMEWRALILERRERGRCLKLQGEQASRDWLEPGKFVWRRKETVSVLLHEGFVDHAERELTWRSESGDVYSSTTVIDLYAPPAPIPAGEFRARLADIRAALQFSSRLQELLKPRGEPDYRGYDDLLRAIDRHTDQGSPYAAAIRSIRRQAQLARAGERPPEPIVVRAEPPSETIPASTQAAAAPVPAVEVADPTTGVKVSFAAYRGRPVVVLFVRPKSRLLPWVLEYAKAASQSYAGRVHVLVLMVEGDAADAARLREQYQLNFPILSGRRLFEALGGKRTPSVWVLDESGQVRMQAPGWGGEYPDLIHKEVVEALRRE
ncbi:MAG: peroxiredoxin family protein [Gemmataceae bacterium]|nr:peroxiredoxin family protein [Gemmataceae bacterium]